MAVYRKKNGRWAAEPFYKKKLGFMTFDSVSTFNSNVSRRRNYLAEQFPSTGYNQSIKPYIQILLEGQVATNHLTIKH